MDKELRRVIIQQAYVWKLQKSQMCFPFFILRNWGKISAEARGSHCTVLPYDLLERFPIVVDCSLPKVP